MTTGFVKLRRGLLEHLPMLSDAELRVFIGLLSLAKHSGPNKGVWEGSQAELADAIGVTRQRAGKGLAGLSARGWIDQKRSRIRVKKYDGMSECQSDGMYECQTIVQSDIVTENVTNRDIQGDLLLITKDKKDKNTPLPPKGERKPTDEPEGFPDWYQAYPRRVARRDAAKAYRQMIRSGDDRERLEANCGPWYREFRNRDPDKVPYPASFLRGGDWMEPPPVVEGRDDELKRRLMES